MKHPAGAIRTTEEMQALIGKHVFLSAPSTLLIQRVPFVAPCVGKLHPVNIYKNPRGNDFKFMLYVKEDINAAAPHGIAVDSDWSVRWLAPRPIYFFSNFWFAHAHVLQRDDLRA